jgi:hypothetical protein
MGMVVNMGINDQYFVFRGSVAEEFVKGLEFIGHRQVRLVLKNGRSIKGTLSITKAKTFCLWMECEDLTDATTQDLFDMAIELVISQAMKPHGHS